MEKLRDATIVFLVKRNGDSISEVCLAMKKRGFGVNRWNGVGGKVEAHKGETIEAGAKRETNEEIGVSVNQLDKVAELTFYFPHNPDWNQLVHVFFSESWEGEPEESEEMKPDWFLVENIPFSEMWPDDIYWVPEILKGNLVKGVFSFGEGDTVLEKKVNIVENLING